MKLHCGHYMVTEIQHIHTSSNMSEDRWGYQTFNIPVKRARPRSPIDDSQIFDLWNDYGYRSNDTSAQPSGFVYDTEASWNAPSKTIDKNNEDVRGSKPQMQTGCIPCL